MKEYPSDEELMVAYQLGEERAFAALYERHSGRVFGFIRSKIRDEAASSDVLQSTFLKLHKSRSKYDRTFPFVPWLFTICRSEVLDSFKKSHRLHETLVGETPEPEFQPVADTASELNLAALPPAQREAVMMRFEQDFSFEEIAQRLNTSPANARQLISRAVRTLRGLYGKK